MSINHVVDCLQAAPRIDQPEHLIPLLQYLPGFGCQSYWRLLAASNGMASLLSLPLDYLLKCLPAAARGGFRQLYQQREQSDFWRRYCDDWARLSELGITLITHQDVRYPESLSNIASAPPQLYVQGAVELLNKPQMAFVGSRQPTPSGADIAFEFASALGRSGLVICSGLAMGIDGQAHRGALAVGASTIGVMGTGIDRVYPAKHRTLAEQIVAEGGALVSEFLPGAAPVASHFPRRNRIISGLSLGVLVVEAALKSGSLISARYALEQNREVFAVPGSIRNPQSAGCHQLLQQGAALASCPEDVLEALSGWHNPLLESAESETELEAPVPLSDIEQLLWQQIGFENTSIDSLVNRSQRPINEVLSGLMTLEIKGMVAQCAGGYQRLS
jgi:DNA processing protein